MLYSFSLIWARSFSLMYTDILSKGKLKKSPHDQYVRKGAPKNSLIDLEIIAISSPFHAELIAFECYLYIIYHLSAAAAAAAVAATAAAADHKYCSLSVISQMLQHSITKNCA